MVIKNKVQNYKNVVFDMDFNLVVVVILVHIIVKVLQEDFKDPDNKERVDFVEVVIFLPVCVLEEKED